MLWVYYLFTNGEVRFIYVTGDKNRAYRSLINHLCAFGGITGRRPIVNEQSTEPELIEAFNWYETNLPKYPKLDFDVFGVKQEVVDDPARFLKHLTSIIGPELILGALKIVKVS